MMVGQRRPAMPLFRDIGNSNLTHDVDRGLGLAVNLHKMNQEAALSREKMGIERDKIGMLRESHGQEIAINQQTIEQNNIKIASEKKQAEWNNTPIDLRDNPLIKDNLGPDGAQKLHDDFVKSYGSNGTLTREQFQKGLSDTHTNQSAWNEVMDLGKKNWERRRGIDSENAQKSKEKFDKDPSDENHKKLLEAQGKDEESKKGSDKFGIIRTTVDKQREMKAGLEPLKTSDPALYKEISTAPDYINAYNNGNTDAADKAVQNIRTERKTLQAARIHADAIKAKAREGMTDNQKAIREEKAKKETNDNYDKERKSILGKYKLTSEQREFVERGDNPAAVKGISKENADKINKELTASKLRYDDRYQKKFGERPAGSKRFTNEQQASHNEYSAARNKILNAKTKKDGSTVTSEERNAALQSLDEEARNDGLVE
jgi:hypothetical protein